MKIHERFSGDSRCNPKIGSPKSTLQDASTYSLALFIFNEKLIDGIIPNSGDMIPCSDCSDAGGADHALSKAEGHAFWSS